MAKKTPQFFCAVKASAFGRRCQWPRGHVITWRVDRPLTGFAKRDYEQICQMAFNQWSAVSGVLFEQNNRNANINITTRSIDGRNGILAEAELPCGNVGPGSSLSLWMDTNENWVHAENPAAGAMDVLRVLTHEIGHNLGLDHAPQRSRNLMAPTVSNIRAPQPGWDIPQVVDRYGERVVAPTPELPGGELCAGLIDLLRGGNTQGIGGGGIKVWLERAQLLMEYWDEIQELIECFTRLSQDERLKALKTLKRLRE